MLGPLYAQEDETSLREFYDSNFKNLKNLRLIDTVSNDLSSDAYHDRGFSFNTESFHKQLFYTCN